MEKIQKINNDEEAVSLIEGCIADLETIKNVEHINTYKREYLHNIRNTVRDLEKYYN